jgi:hypothetical protein
MNMRWLVMLLASLPDDRLPPPFRPPRTLTPCIRPARDPKAATCSRRDRSGSRASAAATYLTFGPPGPDDGSPNDDDDAADWDRAVERIDRLWVAVLALPDDNSRKEYDTSRLPPLRELIHLCAARTDRERCQVRISY